MTAFEVPTVALVVAHQGGWDELLFVVVPLVIFAALLAVARRRVDPESEPDDDAGSDP